ncbi:MAG TPA: hypothetical protein VIF09_20880 [Polyangiaceae bacterium]|jgi:hypothetical protein
MQLTLTTDETRLLIQHLVRRIDEMDAELVHTDKRELQRGLARDLQMLRALTDKVRLAARGPAEAMPDVV